MKFGDVLDALMDGKPVSRASWEKHMYYDEPANAFVISYSKDNEWMSFSLDINATDVIADDWEICEWDDHIVDANEKVDK